MFNNIIYPNGNATISVAASDKVAVYSLGNAKVYKVVGYPQHPSTSELLAEVTNGQVVTAAFSAAGTVRIDAGASPVYYEVGTDAVVKGIYANQRQGDPVALNATGALTSAAILGGLVTSTTAAAVAGTLPTGAVLDAAADFAIGESFDWSVNATGANAFTVTAAASGHTVVGNMVVASGKAGLFRTRKTAADTFITYSLANT
jgi:hypothetical protein